MWVRAEVPRVEHTGPKLSEIRPLISMSRTGTVKLLRVQSPCYTPEKCKNVDGISTPVDPEPNRSLCFTLLLYRRIALKWFTHSSFISVFRVLSDNRSRNWSFTTLSINSLFSGTVEGTTSCDVNFLVRRLYKVQKSFLQPHFWRSVPWTPETTPNDFLSKSITPRRKVPILFLVTSVFYVCL